MDAKLYLIPNLLGESSINAVLPANINQIIASIKHYIVEDERTVRRFLKKIDSGIQIDELTFYVLNKQTKKNELSEFLKPLKDGFSVGIISEAGVPGVADPGAEIVSIAHEMNICVVPLVGPSSILLSLMASGLNGQNFAFIGYLPIKQVDRIRKIKQIESRSSLEKQTQIFIETPYRNMQLLEDLVKTCYHGTRLCIAANITTSNEFIKTKTVAYWKNNLPDLHKQPAIFLLLK
ncbi:MAG: SAM-dependent methyltransferase [Bacteroidota bacterium]